MTLPLAFTITMIHAAVWDARVQQGRCVCAAEHSKCAIETWPDGNRFITLKPYKKPQSVSVVCAKEKKK